MRVALEIGARRAPNRCFTDDFPIRPEFASVWFELPRDAEERYIMPSKSIADRIPTSFDTCFQRSYAVEAPDMRRLYENAKRDQWNASKDIDWTTNVDPERGIFADELIDGHGTPTLDRLDPRAFQQLNIEFSCWRLSQLLHGEEGAMLATHFNDLTDLLKRRNCFFRLDYPRSFGALPTVRDAIIAHTCCSDGER